MNRLSDSYRQMVVDARQKIANGASHFLTELGDDKTVAEDTYKQFRMRLLGGNYRSRHEKKLLLKILDELKKVLNS